MQNQYNIPKKWEDRYWYWSKTKFNNLSTANLSTYVKKIDGWRVRGENNMSLTDIWSNLTDATPVYWNPFGWEVQGYVRNGYIKLYATWHDLNVDDIPSDVVETCSSSQFMYTFDTTKAQKEDINPNDKCEKKILSKNNKILIFDTTSTNTSLCQFGFAIYDDKIVNNSLLNLDNVTSLYNTYNIWDVKIEAELYDNDKNFVRTVTVFENGKVNNEFVRDTIW